MGSKTDDRRFTPCEFIGFGAMDVTKPYKLMGFGGLAMHVAKPYKFIGFGAMDVTKSIEFYRVWGTRRHQNFIFTFAS